MAGAVHTTRHTVYERTTSSRTELQMTSDGAGRVLLNVSAAEDGVARAWVIRLNLLPGQRAVRVLVDGAANIWGTHIYPPSVPRIGFFPFGAPL